MHLWSKSNVSKFENSFAAQMAANVVFAFGDFQCFTHKIFIIYLTSHRVQFELPT
jgi:hypothetical protein